MAGVPTTLTAIDKQEEVRKLHLEIAGLTSTKDIADRAAKQAVEAATTAKERAEHLQGVLDGLEASQAAAAGEIREFVADMCNVLQTVMTIMEETAMQANELSAEVDRLCAEIEKATAQLKAVQEVAAKEGVEISRKRDDLDIYHHRIVDAAKIHLPGKEIRI